MKINPSALLIFGCLLFSTSAIVSAQADHKEHHPASASASSSASAKAASAAAMSSSASDAMSKSDAQIKMMQNMHKKMMGAKSPEERKALMVEHMKLMREGMAMMKAMGADGKPKMQGDMHKEMNMHQMMERRMEMMESMMQMMMDAMPMPAATK